MVLPELSGWLTSQILSLIWYIMKWKASVSSPVGGNTTENTASSLWRKRDKYLLTSKNGYPALDWFASDPLDCFLWQYLATRQYYKDPNHSQKPSICVIVCIDDAGMWMNWNSNRYLLSMQKRWETLPEHWTNSVSRRSTGINEKYSQNRRIWRNNPTQFAHWIKVSSTTKCTE